MSTGRIPGNLLSEGTMIVSVGLFTEHMRQFYEEDVVAFQVVDTMDGDSARGDVGWHIEGVVRPLLRRETKRQGDLSSATRGAGGRP